jgi:hypothetical protein
MNESDLSRIHPHRTGLLVGFFLGGASVFFGIVAIGIMLSGDTAFEVVGYGLGIESRYIRVLISPFILFFGGYVFAYTICKCIHLLSALHENRD